MAPSYKCAVISFLVVFSVLSAANPSAAIRSSEPEAAAGGKSSHALVAPAPAPRGARDAKLQFFFGCPSFPKILRDLCHALFPPPTPSPPDEPRVCRPSLAARLVSPCAAFLTNSSVSEPSTACCDNVRSFFGDSSTSPYCLCHVANGDVDPMLPAPVVNPARRVSMLVTCYPDVLDTDYVNEVCDKDSTYRKFVPPMDPPGPPAPPTPSLPDAREVCRPSLAARLVSPCAAFLTNSSVLTPSIVCCNNVRYFFSDNMSPFCLCHVANGDMDPMLPAPVVDPARRVSMLVTCYPDRLDTDYVNYACDKDGPVYWKYVPPMDPPSPPPAPGKKEA